MGWKGGNSYRYGYNGKDSITGSGESGSSGRLSFFKHFASCPAKGVWAFEKVLFLRRPFGMKPVFPCFGKPGNPPVRKSPPGNQTYRLATQTTQKP